MSHGVHDRVESIREHLLLALELHDQIPDVVDRSLPLGALVGLVEDGGDLRLGHDEVARRLRLLFGRGFN